MLYFNTQSLVSLMLLIGLTITFLAPSPMMLGFTILLVSMMGCLWVSMVAQPWVALIMFLTLGGAVLVGFVFILALDSDPASRAVSWRWNYSGIPLFTFFILMSVSLRFLPSKGDVLWMSSESFTIPLFSSANFYFFILLLMSLVGAMVAVVKMVPSQQGCMRAFSGQDFFFAGVTSKTYKKVGSFILTR